MELYELAQAAGGAIDPDVFKCSSPCVPGRGWRASPRTLRPCPCPHRAYLKREGETKAAVLEVEAWHWQNVAAGKDPARGCPASPVPPGCPRGVDRGRAPRGAAPETGGDFSHHPAVGSPSPQQKLCVASSSC
ncbi:uncharacterized protein LOC131398465 isoform X3 [Diceros bicornis minor]|nr:uncharacterized protein LOC131398465 isoform X3 [Diceros bicornis minor]